MHVLSELERIGWAFQAVGAENLKCKCPLHDDTRSSCSIHVETGKFKCHAAGCGKHGDFVTFLAAALKTSRAVVEVDLAQRYDLDTEKIIPADVVERAHTCIWGNDLLRTELYKRGVTDAEIRKYRLGVWENRIWIPIKSASGNFVNVRKYLPGAPSADKMLNMRGRGVQMRLYPIEQLDYDTIVLCGGEVKAIVTAAHLNKANIGAVTTTGGEGNWHPSLSNYFANKRVYIMMDVDKAGKAAAAMLAPVLRRVAKWVGVVDLPLDVKKFPHGDVNDFVATGGVLLPVIMETPEWASPIESPNEDEPPRQCKLANCVEPANVGRKLKFQSVVAATGENSFIVPKSVFVACNKDDKACEFCSVYSTEQNIWTIAPDSPAILQMIGTPTEALDKGIRAAIGIPSKCRSVKFEIKDHHQCEDVRLNPSLAITNRDTDRTMMPAVIVGTPSELNAPYVMTGRMYPHPATQVATLVIAEKSAAVDALSTYTPRDVDKLKIFQPLQWTCDSILEFLDGLYNDLAANVTQIWMRPSLHLATDLSYHSPLLLSIDGKTVKGWTEILVIGDSAQGKSETVISLMAHYQLGEKIECKNSSVPGLLGGLRQLGNAWYVSWGIIPTHDRRLVFLEELKGASTDVIAHLTDMRSSGIAELPKVERRRTHARTRLIAASNPRSSRPISAYNYGIEAILELVGAPEDVRRFDAAFIVAASDIDSSKINAIRRSPPKVDHVYTSELCHELVLWCWTRTIEQVEFDSGVITLAGDLSVEMCDTFSDNIPLVDKGSQRQKVLRLAAALAGRTFSTRDGTTLLVRKCHVEAVCKLLHREYSSDSFGYAAYSHANKTKNTLTGQSELKSYIEALPYPEDFVESILNADQFDLQDIMDWCSWTREQAQSLITLFVRKRAIARSDRWYHKTSGFIKWLRSTTFNTVRPDHLTRKDF